MGKEKERKQAKTRRNITVEGFLLVPEKEGRGGGAKPFVTKFSAGPERDGEGVDKQMMVGKEGERTYEEMKVGRGIEKVRTSK